MERAELPGTGGLGRLRGRTGVEKCCISSQKGEKCLQAPKEVILADALRKVSLEMPPPQKEAWAWRSLGQSMAGVGERGGCGV